MLWAALAAVLAMYWPGLDGGFLFDDYANIVSNEKLKIKQLDFQSLVAASQSGDAGPLGRPVSLASFAINHALFGLDARSFKLVNLLIHCLTGVFLFLMTVTLLECLEWRKGREEGLHPSIIAAAAAVLWLVHPLHLSTVLYAVQRMAELSALFTVVGLWLYLRGRLRQLHGKPAVFHFLGVFGFCLPLAVFSKENGALLPLYLFVLEWTVLRFRLPGEAASIRFRRLVYLVMVVGVVSVLGYLLAHPGVVLGGYENREFTLFQRLLTETRVLWFYISLLIVPATSRMGLFHDDISVSHGLFDPVSTAMAQLGLLLLVGLALWIRKRQPVMAFGIFFFLAGHVLESTVFPLELAFEHRNYLPSYGLMLSLSWLLLVSAAPFFSTPRLSLVTVFGFVLVFSLSTFSRAVSWGDPVTFAFTEAAHHPGSARAQYELGRAYADALDANPSMLYLYPLAVMQLERSSRLSGSLNDGLFRLLPLSNRFAGKIPETWVEALVERLSRGVYPANNVNLMDWLVSCPGGDARCEIPPKLIETLLKASLDNPNLVGRARSELLVVASKFYLEKMKDRSAALAFIKDAVASAPDVPRFHIYLAQLLQAMGRGEEALVELERAELLDVFGAHRPEIVQLRSALQ